MPLQYQHIMPRVGPQARLSSSRLLWQFLGLRNSYNRQNRAKPTQNSQLYAKGPKTVHRKQVFDSFLPSF